MTGNNTEFKEVTGISLDVPLHSEVVTVELRSGSDNTNDLIRLKKYLPLRGRIRAKGRIFLVRNASVHSTLVVIAETPDAAEAELVLDRCTVTVEAFGCRVYACRCSSACEEQTVRAFFRHQAGGELYAMVNNWGGGNKGENVSEAFVLKEIDSAAELGIDIVQIDDGWQKFSPADTRIYDENGNYTYYHRFDDGFWDVNTEKFPRGIRPIADYARTRKVRIGLWFAPDSRNCFANFERDIAVLKKAYTEWGVRFFKLDMVVLNSLSDRDRYVEFLNTMRAFGDDLELQLDVTGTISRLGYVDGARFGRLFVENRYCCHSQTYYPHLTLGNLWRLAHYIPAQCLQMEVPDILQGADQYAPDDFLAPNRCTMDYVFASIMVSNPLYWMEIQHLDDKEREDLRKIVPVWNREKGALSACDIQPVGCEPNGASVTGFLAVSDLCSYVIAIRELSEEDTLTLSVPFVVRDCELISDGDCKIEHSGMCLSVQLREKLSYAFIKVLRV